MQKYIYMVSITWVGGKKGVLKFSKYLVVVLKYWEQERKIKNKQDLRNNRTKKHARFSFKMAKGPDEILCGYRPQNAGFSYPESLRLGWGWREETKPMTKKQKTWEAGTQIYQTLAILRNVCKNANIKKLIFLRELCACVWYIMYIYICIL